MFECLWIWCFPTILEYNRSIFPSGSKMKQKIIYYVITFHRQKQNCQEFNIQTMMPHCNANRINICLALWQRVRSTSAVHHEKHFKLLLDTQWRLSTSTSSHESTHNTHSILQFLFYVEFVMVVWLCHNAFFYSY